MIRADQQNKYRVQESVDGKFRAQKLIRSRKSLILFGQRHLIWEEVWGRVKNGGGLHRGIWDSYNEAKNCMIEEMERDVKRKENKGKEWGVVSKNESKEENMDDTNYGKAMSLKKEYEDLKKQLAATKKRMLNVKQKAKDELDWILDH